MYVPPQPYDINIAGVDCRFFDAFLVPALDSGPDGEEILLIGPPRSLETATLDCHFLHSGTSAVARAWIPPQPITGTYVRCPVPVAELAALDSGAIDCVRFVPREGRAWCTTAVWVTRPPASQTRRNHVAVQAMFRNGGTPLVEWIEYHRMLGAEHFYLYDHGSTDTSYALLRPYIEQGVVTWLWWAFAPDRGRDENTVQRMARNHCLLKYGRFNEWIGFFDVDEFFQAFPPRDIPGFLECNANIRAHPFGVRCRTWFFGARETTSLDSARMRLDECVYRASRASRGRSTFFVMPRNLLASIQTHRLARAACWRDIPPEFARFARCSIDRQWPPPQRERIEDKSLQIALPALKTRVAHALAKVDHSVRTPKRHLIVEAHRAGFFSNFNKVVNHLAHTLGRGGIRSVSVDWQADRFVYGGDGGNSWDTYFDPLPVGSSAEETWVTAMYSQWGMTWKGAYQMYRSGAEWRTIYHDAYTRHIRVNRSIFEKVDRIYRETMDGRYCIGVHYRNPAHHDVECPEPSPPLDVFIDRAKRLSPRNSDPVVFLATDLERAVPQFQARFGDRLVFQHGIPRTLEGHRETHDRRDVDAYVLGESALVDALLLARCDTLLHVVSNVATAAGYINPALRMVYCEEPFLCEYTSLAQGAGWELRDTPEGRRFLGPGGTSVSCNPSGAAVWNLCDGNMTAPEISRVLSQHYRLPWGLVASDVDPTLQHLWRTGIIGPGRVKARHCGNSNRLMPSQELSREPPPPPTPATKTN